MRMTVSAPSEEAGDNAVSPDEIIESLGGCGRFQIRMSVIVHVMKTVVCFTFTEMIIISATPTWWCEDDLTLNNLTSCTVHQNGTTVMHCQEKSCYNGNKTHCQSFGFDSELTTIVNEFSLICDRDFIPSVITSIQISGVLVGNVAAGQIADLFGRKPPFFASIVLLLSFNLVGYFSSSWKMFTVARFFAGMGCGFFLTTQYCLLSEFSLAKWRVWIVGFPSWPIQSCVFALLAWLIHDWRKIQLMTALMAIPCFFAWCVIPESFRWYVAHDKPRKAEGIIRWVADFNKHPEFDIDKALQKPETRENKKYTLIDLFRTKEMVKATFLLSLNWIALGVVTYGIAFGIPTLSGNIYFNLFLFNLTGIPSKAVALWLQNRIGRRYTSVISFATVAIGGIVVGLVQTLDVPNKDILTNTFALIANMGIKAAWGSVQTMTIEIYPTVIRSKIKEICALYYRNIGFGTLSVTGRIGAIVGPQLVYLNTYIQGLLYFVCGCMGILCVCGLMFLPETMDRDLTDKIKQGSALQIIVPGSENNTTSSPKKLEGGNKSETDTKRSSCLKEKNQRLSSKVGCQQERDSAQRNGGIFIERTHL